MEQQLSFSGICLTPYSDVSPDGQCAVLHNLELHDGSLRPSVLAGQQYILPSSGYTLQAVHTTSSFRHLILTAPITSSGVTGGGRPVSQVVLWADEPLDSNPSATLAVQTLSSVSSLLQIQAVGNTIILLTDEGLLYYLWSEGSYKFIGDKLPELGVQYALCGSARSEGRYEGEQAASVSEAEEDRYLSVTISRDSTVGSNGYASVYQEVKGDAAFSDFVHAYVNKLRDEMLRDNEFYAPFFVRCAYCLFDGTIAMASAPVLMVPSTMPHFRVLVFPAGSGRPSTSSSYSDVEDMFGDRRVMVTYRDDVAGHDLCLKNLSQSSLSSWSDIIKSINVYITRQILPEKEDSLITRLYYKASASGWRSNRPTSHSDDDGRNYMRPVRDNFSDEEFNMESFTATGFDIRFPSKTKEDFKEELISSSQFYKIKSISLEEFQSDYSQFTRLSLNKSVLLNIVQQELFDDAYDYRTHDVLMPRKAMVYNSRLMLYDVRRQLFSGFSFQQMVQYFYNASVATVTVYVWIRAEDGLTRIVQSTYTGSLLWPGLFFYYPDSRAFKMVIAYGSLTYEVPLAAHPFLQGAYFLDWDELSLSPLSSFTAPTLVQDAVSELNKVYCSDASNPFVFPVSGIYTIGTGNILGMASVATPLSQGQFGQFKLMAFCSDGNYAMNVTDDGSFSTMTPMQRDVCAVPASITTLDREVLYLSARGAMVTSESRLQCLSSVLDGVSESLPEPLASQLSVPVSDIDSLLQTQHVAFDYPNQRVIFFLSDGVAFVYSLTDNAWSSAQFAPVRAVLNTYPSSYVQYADQGLIVKLSSVYAYTPSVQVSGIVFTRPIKLGSLQLKRLTQYALQGQGFQAKVYIYASSDGLNWHLLGVSSSIIRQHLVGRSFKYFRFALQLSLAADAHLAGLRLGYLVSPEQRFR